MVRQVHKRSEHKTIQNPKQRKPKNEDRLSLHKTKHIKAPKKRRPIMMKKKQHKIRNPLLYYIISHHITLLY